MSMSTAPASRRLSRQILMKVLVLGTIIVGSATIICYFLVYNISSEKTFAYLRQYMLERRQQENRAFLDAYAHLEFFRDEFLKLYLSDIEFSDDEFWNMYEVDKDGATRMKKEFFDVGFDPRLGRTWGVTSFIGNNQSVASRDFKRRLLLSYILVNRYGPAWLPTGILHVTYPENALVIFSPDDPWGLQARPDLPMNELGTIKATLQSENPQRTPVWTGLYYDETVGKWTITFEMPVDDQGRHLINPSLDVSLESIMNRLDSGLPEGAYNLILSKNGYLIAHPGDLRNELKLKGQLSLDKIGDPGLTRMHQEITAHAGLSTQDVSIIEDAGGGNYLFVAPLTGPEWWFVMVLPKALIAREAHQTSQIVLFLGFSLFVLYYFAVHLIIRGQVKLPLRRLQNAVSLVARGEYERVIATPQLLPLEQKNEIGQLAGLFLDMCREVNGVHENLQHIVESRTRELETANAKLRDLSLLDGLTGIHNRRAFDRDIPRVFAQAANGLASFSLMLADIDFFKNYNDRYGHTAGDVALRRISDVIAANIRDCDRVYRYGGEELAVIFNDADEKTAIQVSERLIAAVRASGLPHASSQHGGVTISAGLAAYSPRFASVTDMIDAADASLYAAKSSGRNCLRVSNAS
ncbi:diguanylate cyclase [Desulfovibrio sulfodismutans]|uniref:diguanylate cyclase n=1 Tax=Desulfolutivibrio sulfodismutans TaxID=63561 RepID=A0A7K3NQK8_9BACT|nr:diguanylate cyclase [Desulfolutivibrio sulfodismutans]NDY58073.1 diguanylate cyclase [Desulfolutivibrio sulfodismutans]